MLQDGVFVKGNNQGFMRGISFMILFFSGKVGVSTKSRQSVCLSGFDLLNGFQHLLHISSFTYKDRHSYLCRKPQAKRQKLSHPYLTPINRRVKHALVMSQLPRTLEHKYYSRKHRYLFLNLLKLY